MRTTRNIVIGIITGIAATLVLYTGFRLITFDRDDAMAKALVPAASPERPEGSPFSAGYHAESARLADIGRKGSWSADDADRIASIIVPAWPDVPREPEDMVQTEQMSLLRSSLAILGGRRQAGLEIPADLAGEYRRSIVGMLEHPRGYIRQTGAAAAGNGLWLDDPEIGPMVVQLARHDPDEGVRRTATIKLGQAAGVESPADYCPTCPKSTP